MKEWIRPLVGFAMIIGVSIAPITLGIMSAKKTGSEFAGYRREIIARLWKTGEGPEDVTSKEIAARLTELQINVNEAK